MGMAATLSEISLFNDLQADLGISANVLADRLETLVAEGLPDGRGPVRVLHDCGTEVRVDARCPHCEREVAPTELRVRPRGRVADAPKEGEPGHLAARRVTAARDGARLAQPNVNA
jgi:hypothetical protein